VQSISLACALHVDAAEGLAAAPAGRSVRVSSSLTGHAPRLPSHLH
jgi:hypothetical protein